MAWLLLLVPLVGAFSLLAARRRLRLLLPLAVAGSGATLGVGVWAAATGASGAWRWGESLSLALDVEGLGAVMVVLVPAVALPVITYAAASMAGDAGLARLLALLLAFVGAMLVLVAASNLLTLLVAWELVGIASWALIAHDWRDPEAPPLALHAFLATRTGDLGLVAAAGVTLAVAGSTDYQALGDLSGWPVHVAAGGLLLAAAAKSAQLPFSPWLFSAMAGPTPASALLHSATMVAAGAYVLARTVPLLDAAPWLPTTVAGLGLATAIAGGVVASVQTDLKRALAASTSAQYGLILVAVGAGSTAAAGTHLVTHATLKALLFLGAGVALHSAGTLDLRSLRLGRALPFVAVTFAVGALALAAVPPLGAARSKEDILAAAAHSGAWLAAGVLVASFLSALYAGRLALLAYGSGPRPGSAPAFVDDRGRSAIPIVHKSSGREGDSRLGTGERWALSALAAATLALSVLWLPGASDLIEEATGGVLFVGETWELAASVAAVAAAAGLIALLARQGRLATLALPPRVQAGVAAWLGLPALSKHLVVDPVLALSRALATIDDRVVDAGVRAASWVAASLSRLVATWSERGVDGLVHGVAGMTLRGATVSRLADERAVDRAVEELARGTSLAGHQSRRLQTGMSHHYYVMIALGLGAVVVIATLGA
ncbi:MAG: NADH-quinone oxidoreductase subunit L [Actinomycetota bacterium]|nr:NADH-quinone oxidoreductase subunit L [Actinomycetota bacterium]